MPTKIRACVRPEDMAKLTKIEVESEDDLRRVAEQYDVPILDCGRDGIEAVIDARTGVSYQLKKKLPTFD
jgi:hypothetical protein